MGYFGRIKARARNQEGWSDYKYTGSAAAGADLVSEDTWCVVYEAEVYYQGSEEKLSSLNLSTNFVNPLSSGNPCTVSCYLYTFDPTQNGSFAADAPPAGFYSAVSRSFEASTVGDFVSFAFGTGEIRPAKVYFWFTSTVTYESYGSNSIYHYATGNYDSAMHTGTKTPLLTGGFEGTDTGGGSTGGSGTYNAIASGAYSDIYTQWDFSYSRARLDASYTQLSFKSAGTVSFTCKHASGGDSYLQMRCYLSIGNGFDSTTGTPTGTILASAAGGDELSFSCQVTSGQSYCLWSVIDYCGTDTVPLRLTVDPGGWYYSIADKGSHLSLDRGEKNFSMSMGQFQTGRITLSFAYSSTVDISVSASEGAFAGVLYISEQPDIDSSTGIPLSCLTSISAGIPGAFNVIGGRTYYFFAVYNGGSDAGSIAFGIKAPPQLWYQGGSSTYRLLAESKSFSVSLSPFHYHRLSLSFAYSGTARISCPSASAGDGELWLYYGEIADIDESNGLALNWEETYGGKSLDVSVEVMAGKSYSLIIRNSLPGLSLGAGFTLIPPGKSLPYVKNLESYRHLETDVSESQPIVRFGYNESRLTFKYRGTSVISAAKAQNQSGNTPHLRAYLTDSRGLDPQSGLPTGTILARHTGEGESFTLSSAVLEDVSYYLYIVSSEIYLADTSQLDIYISAPTERFFSITETGECYAMGEAYTYSASPGESGVLRLELNFGSGGGAKIAVKPLNGSAVPLRMFLSHSPYLDGRTGAPYERIAEASGGGDGTAFSFNLSAEEGGSYYLFVRCGGIYDRADFEVSVRRFDGAAHIYSNGQFLRAQPFVYRDGAWHRAVPYCRGPLSWNMSG